MLADRLAERPPLARIGKRCVERRARHADRLRGDADAPALEVRERDPVTIAFAPEQVRCRDRAILEHDLRRIRRALAELFLDARDDKAGRLRLDDERRDAFLPGRLVGYREDDRDVGVRARRDELLDAVQHIARRRGARRAS